MKQVLIIIGQNIKRHCSEKHRYPEGSQHVNNELLTNTIALFAGEKTHTVNTSVVFISKSMMLLSDFGQTKQKRLKLDEKGEIVQPKTSKKSSSNTVRGNKHLIKSYAILSSRSPGLMTTAPCFLSLITAASRS